jgi:hypothetical protein
MEDFENYSPYFEDDELDLSPDQLCADYPDVGAYDDGSRTPVAESKGDGLDGENVVHRGKRGSENNKGDDLVIKNMAENVLADVMQHVHIGGESGRNSARAD